MQCDRKRESRGYLERVLIDGAKPFLYRSRVRTLLGLPEWDGDNRIFSSPSLPAGFKYGRGLPQDGPFAGAQYSNRTGERRAFVSPATRYDVSEETDLNIFASGRAFPYEPEEDMLRRISQSSEAFEDKTSKDDNPAKGAESSCHRRSEPFETPVIAGLAEKYEAAGPAHGPAASPETGRGRPGLNPPSGPPEIFAGNPVKETGGNDLAENIKDGSDAVSDAPMDMETTTIEIPGFSKPSQRASSLLSVEDIPRPKAEMGSPETAFRPPLQSDFFDSPELTIEGKDCLLTDADDEKKRQAERGLNNTVLRGLQLPDNRPAETDPPPVRHEGPPDQRIEQVPVDHSLVDGSDESRFEARGKASATSRNQGQSFVKPVSLPPERMASYHIGDGEEAGGFHGIGSSHAGALERIEQIHRALRGQAARTSAEQNRRNEEPMSEQPAMEMPPLPPPNVIITRAPSPQARVPRAFWQRRYLGHFHMRPLR